MVTRLINSENVYDVEFIETKTHKLTIKIMFNDGGYFLDNSKIDLALVGENKKMIDKYNQLVEERYARNQYPN